MQAKDIMTRQVATVHPDDPVTAIVRLFRAKAISGVPVVDDQNCIVGIITELDLIARHARPHFPSYIQFLDSVIYLEGPKRYRESMRRIMATTAGELMTTPAQTAPPDMDVQDLATLMVERHLNPVPIVDDEDRLVGIVSRTDLLAMIEQAGEQQAGEQQAGD